mmetsp:Transcript_11942/g.44433  ORF Transcript_11942/g.44433 Transcript_11942/m.44433 type:complete len:99 (-) Transcript_11942:18-314(-)
MGGNPTGWLVVSNVCFDTLATATNGRRVLGPRARRAEGRSADAPRERHREDILRMQLGIVARERSFRSTKRSEGCGERGVVSRNLKRGRETRRGVPCG